ncbi:hypothetical protein AKJ48_03910 [candidate division MSBL1 archaeon SCGC-AAA261O19]|uniref:PIN domain-containing protein n=1 Tax=candidate division MSBL1 archaeon SCGC-AAA261O19 TaxID=1698277 RepID=A0A133VAD4_9EURY|nr:hypothetical protein AKJ48_03910 [candidate division MSBL1 archaeon SCGC-AAA261O19]
MEGQEKIVLDASVVVKWFSQEEGSDLALEVKNQYVEGELIILSADLLIYEVSNALMFNPDFDQEDVANAVKDIFDLDLDLITPIEEILIRATEYASENNLTIYDSCYISLAEMMGIPLYTADGKLLENTEDLDFVKSLKYLQG